MTTSSNSKFLSFTVHYTIDESIYQFRCSPFVGIGNLEDWNPYFVDVQQLSDNMCNSTSEAEGRIICATIYLHNKEAAQSPRANSYAESRTAKRRE